MADDRFEIRLSGSGGQGIILASIILAEAAGIFVEEPHRQSPLRSDISWCHPICSHRAMGGLGTFGPLHDGIYIMKKGFFDKFVLCFPLVGLK